MTKDLKELTSLQQTVNRLQREHDQATGAVQQALKSLKSEFGCATLEEAAKLLDSMAKQETTARAAYEREYKKFMKEHGDALG